MKHKTLPERGQALLFIALAAVGLIALTALAIDGGNFYAERRRAQNAADAAALDAALAKVRGQDLYAEGLKSAKSNNYVDTDAGEDSSSEDVNVEIYNPPHSRPYFEIAEKDQYIQVFITVEVHTYFAPIVGRKTLETKVEAVARWQPPTTGAMAFGNAVVGLAPHECKAVTYQGNASTIITGAGIYVNSDCEDAAFFNNSSSAQLSAPCLQSVGGITYKSGALAIPDECILRKKPALPPINYPNPTCSNNAEEDKDHPGYLKPGNVSGNFPPSGITHLYPGVYCVDGNFRMNSHDSLIGSDVVIVIKSGDVRWEGGTIQLDAPNTGPFKGLLIFMPETNKNELIINGNSSSSFTGTFLAPSANVTINGTGGVDGMNSQIIGYTVDISGTTTMKINYSVDDNYDALISPAIELVQ